MMERDGPGDDAARVLRVRVPFAGTFCAFSNPDVEDVARVRFHVFALRASPRAIAPPRASVPRMPSRPRPLASRPRPLFPRRLLAAPSRPLLGCEARTPIHGRGESRLHS